MAYRFQLGVCASAILLSACSGSNGTGVFGGPLPSGRIVVAAAAGTTLIPQTQGLIFSVPGSGFAVTVREDNYGSGFDAAVVSYTSPTTIPCWKISVDQSYQPNVVTFVPAIVPDPVHPGFNICPVRGDSEAVRFVDQRGNAAIYTFVTI